MSELITQRSPELFPHVSEPTDTRPTRSKAAPRARIIAFYLPQFHPIPENDEWWGRGFTEWTNVGRAKPLFPGHLQPRLPTELGYYDLRLAETREQQSALARQYGVEGFCYWHYWFEGRRLLERPISEVLASGQPDFPFCLGWANQTWTGIWHGAPDRILIRQTYGGQEDARRHFNAVLPALADSRYIRVDGCPIFVLHQPNELPEPRMFTALWREWARAEGLPGIFFVGAEDGGWSPYDSGFDGVITSNPWRIFQFRRRPLLDRLATKLARRPATWHSHHLFSWQNLLGWPTQISYRDVLRYGIPSEIGPAEFPSILPNWDNTPRAGRNGVVITGSTPDLFYQHIDHAVAAIESRPFDQRLVFLKSWNEWAEGNFVEPDALYGRGYLEAIHRVQYARSPKVSQQR